MAKKKRSVSDYLGWDRKKKKSVGEEAMLNSYLETMEKEVMGERRRGAPPTAWPHH